MNSTHPYSASNKMKYVIQFLIIIAFSFVGELLHYFIPLPIPASIYALVLLFLALEFKLVKVSDIQQASAFLISAMPVMFIPAAVGLLDSWCIVKTALVPYLIITVVSTLIVMGASGLVTQAVIKKENKKDE